MLVHHRRFAVRVSFAGLMCVAMACSPLAEAQGPVGFPPVRQRPDRAQAVEPQAKTGPVYVPNRLIVKFKAEGPSRVTLPIEVLGRRAIPEGAPDQEPMYERYRSLFQLNAECKLKAIEPLLPRPDLPANQPLAARAASEPNVARDISTKFPKRAKRAAVTKGRVSELSAYFVLEFEPGAELEEYRKRYLANPFVESVEYDRLFPLHLTPNDPFFATKGTWGQDEDDLWGHKKMRMEAAWEVSQGEGTIVAVLDSGLDYKHKDLADNIWTNPNEVPGNGLDDDGNGFVDDVIGWDFWDGDADPMDENGHGTHVAGTIAAVGDNNEGIIGVAPKAKVMALKGGGGGSAVSLVAMTRGFLYAIGNGADVANCSWGPSASDTRFSPLLEEIIQFARQVGMVVVFASGNDGQFMTHASPIIMRDVLAVGACVPDDSLAAFSNIGPRLGVVAPGGGRNDAPNFGRNNVLSLKASVIGDDHQLGRLVVGEEYLRLAGTSMAAPHVSGLVALILARRPDFTVDEVVATIKATCDDVGEPGFDLQTGYGRVNAANSLAVERPLQVRIEAPSDNATLVPTAGKVAVMGRVGGAGVRQWRLAFSPLGDLGQVETIGTPETSPRDGLLQTWDVSALATGAYLLRLIATDQAGRTYQDVVAVGRSGPPATVLAKEDRLRWTAAVSEGRVAWIEANPFSFAEESALETIDLATNQRRRLGDLAPGYAQQLDLDGQWVVHDLRVPDPSGTVQVVVVLRNLETDSVESLAKFPSEHPWLQVALGGGRVYWTDESDVIFAQDLVEGAQLRSLDQVAFAELAADGDYLAWTDDIDVFVMNVVSNTVHALSQDRSPTGAWTGFANRNPSIQGGRVAWKRYKHGEPVATVMTFDLSSGIRQIVARDLPNVRGVVVSGSHVFWDDLRLAQQDVSASLLNGGEQRRITGEMANQFVIAAEGTRVLTLNQRRAQIGDDGVGLYDLALVEIATPAAFQGTAIRQDGVDYVSSTAPDGRSISLNFSSFRCDLEPDDEELVAKKDLTVAFPFREQQQGGAVRVVLRGTLADCEPRTGANVIVLVGGTPSIIELTGTDGEFQKELSVKIPSGTNLTVSFWLVLERSTGKAGGGRLQLDSAEFSLHDGP